MAWACFFAGLLRSFAVTKGVKDFPRLWSEMGYK
jgi:hypothetical protein